MTSEAKLLVVQFLRWVDSRPRTYADVREAWPSACPLNCAWEDATTDALVAFDRDGRLTLTASGRERLRQADGRSRTSNGGGPRRDAGRTIAGR